MMKTTEIELVDGSKVRLAELSVHDVGELQEDGSIDAIMRWKTDTKNYEEKKERGQLSNGEEAPQMPMRTIFRLVFCAARNADPKYDNPAQATQLEATLKRKFTVSCLGRAAEALPFLFQAPEKTS